jgi:hypothetical protein
MSLTERWEQLAPGLRRGLVLGGAAAVAVALAALLVSAPKEEHRFGEERKRLITNLLTDADPRALGIEGLAERLRRVEGRLDQVASGLEKLGLTKDAEPGRRPPRAPAHRERQGARGAQGRAGDAAPGARAGAGAGGWNPARGAPDTARALAFGAPDAH